MNKFILFLWLPVILTGWSGNTLAQTATYTTVNLTPGESYQTVTGFGASLAFYENWLTAHPKKTEIYDIIFRELSLDILRVRNTFDYESTMIGRVKEFYEAARKSLGKPIDIMVSSWGPPAYLKSNNSVSNGGTIKYTVSGGKVTFRYDEFARWWSRSLDNYNSNGIFPAYISIQNEPDWKASYESCLLKPAETITAADTVAGYNKALAAVYDTLATRNVRPKILGPECIGIGYNAVENYVNALDIRKLDGIAHHLYHGTDETNPFISDNFTKVGKFHPEIPHFQTEYSRGDWFPLAGMIYKTFTDENAVAYFFWDLIWDNGGLVDLDFPWDSNRWSNPKGYTRTKHFYVFRQFSAYIHPGWKRIKVNSPAGEVKTLAFISSGRDSATLVAINTSTTASYGIKVSIQGYSVDSADISRTSASEDGITDPGPADSLVLRPRSVTTVGMKISGTNPASLLKTVVGDNRSVCTVFPNPVRESAIFRFPAKEKGYYSVIITDLNGRKMMVLEPGYLLPGEYHHFFRKGNLPSGIYLFRIETNGCETAQGKFCITQ
jgi:glucuronoarabinoxylan endo-1,4-beta-xylanase